MNKENHNCDILICYHNNTKGLCCLYNPDNCKYKQLQKENAELKKSCDETQELLDKQIEATYKLDKENAELKADNVEWEKASDKWKSVYEITNNQLTKAKELLKQWLQTSKASGCDNINIVTDTEQFLNCSEKPNTLVKCR